MKMVGNLRSTLGIAAFAGALGASVALADTPDELRIGITTFSSDAATVVGVPARHAAEMFAEQVNERGGIQGVPVSLYFIDEGAGMETLRSEYRRLVDDVNVDVMFAAISSGSCNNLAPLAEDLEILNFMWDCGTQRIFEEDDYEWVFRTQANATPEILATFLYLMEHTPDFGSIAVVNQDYAWGRESWAIFRALLETLKPDVEIVAELFPAFGAPDYSTEISRLQALRPLRRVGPACAQMPQCRVHPFARAPERRRLLGRDLVIERRQEPRTAARGCGGRILRGRAQAQAPYSAARLDARKPPDWRFHNWA